MITQRLEFNSRFQLLYQEQHYSSLLIETHQHVKGAI